MFFQLVMEISCISSKWPPIASTMLYIWLTECSAGSMIKWWPGSDWGRVTTSFRPIKDVSLVLGEATDLRILKVT